MANWYEPTDLMRAQFRGWVEERPPRIRETIERLQLAPWKLYRLDTTDRTSHRVYISSFGEPRDPAAPVTVRVMVTGEFNLVAMEREVFGIDPRDLVECELPTKDEPLGDAGMTPEQVRYTMERPIGRSTN
jgi:hypothetical protein